MKNVPTIIIALIISLIVPTICIVRSVQFDQECGGYLKQAADANTPELALERLNKALNYIEDNDLTTGYTSVLWRTEDENLEFWYTNLKATQKELEACMDKEQLEKTNVLMKVRETLTDEGEKGTNLTIPPGISKYPANTLLCILMWLSIALLIFDVIFFFISLDRYL